MPQIAQLAETYSSQVFWLLLIFGLVFLVVGRGMLPRVMDTVQVRDQQIADDLAAAQAARDEADRQEEAWRSRENANRAAAQALVGEAKAKSRAATEQRLGEVQTGLDAQLEEAEARIEASRAEAVAEIENVASEATQDIVARLAGIEVDRGAAQQAVKGVLAHG